LIANGFAREYYGEAKQSWCNWSDQTRPTMIVQ
jgi:hypothetical protein